MVNLWLRYQPLAHEQVQASVKAMQQHEGLVWAYLDDAIPFTSLLERLLPDVDVVDTTEYRHSLLSPMYLF